MTFRLILTQRARLDRDNAFEWYSSNYSSAFAIRWYEGVSQAVEALRHNPARCHKARENDRFSFELYESLFGGRKNKHRILFKLVGEAVVILQIRHSAQHDLAEEDL